MPQTAAAPSPILAADPTLVSNPGRTMEPAPDASRFAEIESPFPPATTEADDEAAGPPPAMDGVITAAEGGADG